jgi:hypothetical protein
MSRTPRTARIGSERGIEFFDCNNRLIGGLHSPAVPTAYIQVASLILAALALIMGAYLLIVGRRPWRGGDTAQVAPRVRLIGFSYILVFGAAMIQIITEPGGAEAEILGGLMVLGGAIVIVVVYLEARAAARAAARNQSDDRLRN